MQSGTQSDEALVERCARGDESAFKELFDRHHRMVYNLAFRMTGNHSDAEEIAPEVFVKVWRKASEFRGQSRVSTWLYRIAANMAMDRMRSARTTKEVFWEDLAPVDKEMPDLRQATETPEDAAMRREDNRILAAAIERLSADDRLLVTLYHLQGCSYAEIEDITGISQVNIKSKLFRARRRLRDTMVTTQKGDAPDDVQRSTTTTDGFHFAAALQS